MNLMKVCELLTRGSASSIRVRVVTPVDCYQGTLVDWAEDYVVLEFSLSSDRCCPDRWSRSCCPDEECIVVSGKNIDSISLLIDPELLDAPEPQPDDLLESSVLDELMGDHWKPNYKKEGNVITFPSMNLDDFDMRVTDEGISIVPRENPGPEEIA